MTKKALLLIFSLLLLGCNFVMAKRITPEIPDQIQISSTTAMDTNNSQVPNLDLFQPKNTDVTPKFKNEISIKQSLFEILNNSIK